MQYDVFISYAREDAELVELLVGILTGAGVRVFQDKTHVDVYDKLDATLKQAIASSEQLVAIISPSYLESYWCLFEAIEAIEGEDLELRFHPVSVRYQEGDQTFDEDFVLDAMDKLQEQISAFEAKMVAHKAYELAPKLDKLNYVRSKLPVVHRQMYERVFPELRLWDEEQMRASVRGLVEHLAPDANLDWDGIDLSLQTRAPQTRVVPSLGELPTIVWSAQVGHQAWRNRPVLVGNEVVVGGCGDRWNEADPKDGVTCLDARTGNKRWFAATNRDVNHVLVSKGRVVAGCDDGTVSAWSLRTGEASWKTDLGSAVVAGPIKLSGDIASWDGDAQRDPILLATGQGDLVLLDLNTGEPLRRLELKTPILGGFAVLELPLGYARTTWIVVAAADGTVSMVNYDDIGLGLTLRRQVQLDYPSEYVDEGRAVPLLAATPTASGDVVFVGLVRETKFDAPPLVAIRVPTGEIVWRAQSGLSLGNLRGAPTLHGTDLLYATAYDDSLRALHASTGERGWQVDLGPEMFEHWSSPVVVGDAAFVGRHDGYLHKVDLDPPQRAWSLYLGSHDRAGSAYPKDQEPPEFADRAAWSAAGSHPILSTPIVDRGRLYIGTAEGWLYCVGNLGLGRSS